MKKVIIITGTLAIALASSTVTLAATYVYELPWTKTLYNVSQPDEETGVSVFDDGNNKCYVAKSKSNGGIHSSDSVAISCVRR